MPFTGQDLLGRAAILLNDTGHVRWPLPEMMGWLNDGLREVASVAPQAVARIAYIQTQPGAIQTMPPHVRSILRVLANVSGTEGTVNGAPTLTAVTARGRAISTVSRAGLDAVLRGWMDPATYPAQGYVSHYIADDAALDRFLVAPPQIGGTWIEVLAAVEPQPYAAPANPTQLASYTAAVDLDDRYQNALLEYLLSKAFQKDAAVPQADARAQAHYAAFLALLGVQPQSRAAVNPATGG